MKTNAKVAPMSCYCKLSTLTAHLKSMSAKRTVQPRKDLSSFSSRYAEPLFKRYI